MLQTLASCFIFLLNLFLPLFPTLVLGGGSVLEVDRGP